MVVVLGGKAEVFDSDKTAAIAEEVIAGLEKLDLLEGYSYYVAGECERHQESFGDLGLFSAGC